MYGQFAWGGVPIVGGLARYMCMPKLGMCFLLHQVKAAVQDICDLCVTDVRLIKDKATSVSRGFCFVELSSVEVHGFKCRYCVSTVTLLILATMLGVHRKPLVCWNLCRNNIQHFS